jgi:photosystem II stability/assembly factor-like uncharacterized protein
MICCDMSETYLTHDGGKHWRMLHLNGMVQDIAYHPANPDVIYAGSFAMYKSEDKGLTWRMILPAPCQSGLVTPDMTIGRVQKILIDRKFPDHIYVGYHTDRFQRPGHGSLKLFASDDGGCSWNDLGVVEGAEFRLIDMSESENGRVLSVFTDSGFYHWDGTTMVKQPMPGGDYQWPISHGTSGIYPNTGQTVFYITRGVSGHGGAMRSGQKGMMSAIFRSFDAGKSWIKLNAPDMDFPDHAISQRTVKDLAVSYYHPGRVYASVWRRPLILPSNNIPGELYDAALRHPFAGKDMGQINRMGIIVSDDYGETWRWSVPIDLNLPDNVAVGWYENAYDADWLGPPWFIHSSDNDPDLAFAALQGFAWITRDGGISWEQVYTEQYEDASWYGRSFESTTCYDVVFDPFDKDTMLITYTDNGILKSVNGGKSWRHAIQGVPYDWINTCYKMVFDPAVPGLAWAVWTGVHDLPDHMMLRLRIAQIPPHAKGGVCITQDRGSTWRPLTDIYAKNCIHTCIELEPDSPVGNRTLYISVCPEGVYKSVDGGNSWELKTQGFGINKNVFFLKLAENGKLYAVTMKTLTDDDTPGDVKQAMWRGGVYVSANGADSWQELSLPAFVEIPQKLDFHPQNPDCIYLTSYPVPVDGDLRGGGVYRSDDGGGTWQIIFDERVQVYGIQIDPINPSNIYIVTAEYAAYRSLDGGMKWERIRGYHFSYGKNPILDPHDDTMMYISTFGASVFHGPRAGGTERYDDIDGFTLNHKLGT